MELENRQVKVPMQQSYLWYVANDGQDQSNQPSGAYIFHPNGTSQTTVSRLVPLTVMRGPFVDEVHQEFSSWIYQVTRLYKDKEYAEVEFTVGPIPVDDGIGKEVISQMTTNMTTNKVFYTDSNGRDFIKRVRDYRTDWDLQVHEPVAGNYYPLNLGIYMMDDKAEFSVLVDRAVGGASIKDGQLELMLHRRLLYDDGRGVGEPLNETVCVQSKCQGLTAGEDPVYSVVAKVELKRVFATRMILNVKEMSLSANQDKSKMKRLKWKVAGDSGMDGVGIRGGPLDDNMVVELGPMEIRTFIVNFK